MSRALSLHRGDSLLGLPVAGVVDLNWHMVTSRGLVRGLNRMPPMTLGPVFASFDTVESLDRRPAPMVRMTHLWVEYKPEFLKEKGVFQAGREVELAVANALGLAGLIVSRFFQGFAYGVLNNVNAVLVPEFIPPSRYGEGLGFYSLGTTVAIAVGPTIGLLLASNVGYTSLFAFGTVVSLLSCVIAARVQVTDVELSAEERHEIMHSFKLSQFIDVKTLPLAICMLFSGMCYAAVTAFLAPYTEELGLGWLASVYFVIYAVFLFVFRPTVGKLEDRFGENAVIYPCIMLMALGFTLLGFLNGLILIILIALLLSAGNGSFVTAMQAIVVKNTPKAKGTWKSSTKPTRARSSTKA